MWASVLLTLVAGSGFGFTSGYQSHKAYKEHDDVICDGYHVVPFLHPNDEVRDAQCYRKCHKDPGGTPGCGNFDAAADEQDSDSLCITPDDCRDLCWSLDECQSADILDGGNLCYLNRWECADEDLYSVDTAYTLYAKEVPWQSECSAKLSVKITGGDLADGTYEPTESNINQFLRSDGLYRVFWSGCEWRVQRTSEIPDEDTASCQDDVAAANFLFGLGDAPNAVGEFDDHICARGKIAGYCNSELFAGVCSHTCRMTDLDRCQGDNHAAAAVLAEHWGLAITDCTLCVVATETSNYIGAYDPVVQSICKSTCGAPDGPEDRRLAIPENTMFSSFQAIGSDRRLASNRELVAMLWKDYFWTEWPQNGPVVCGDPDTDADTRDLILLTDDELCDVLRYEEAITGLHMERVCPEKACYSTVDGQYCPFQNVDAANAVPGSAEETLHNNLCAIKCEADPDAANCTGHDAFFLPDSDAVCLPREECEAICTALGDGCVGIDMHRTLPRCYINAKCDAEVQHDPNYRNLIKNSGRGCYDTESDKFCEEDNLAPAAIPSIRGDACLVKCSDLGPECVGDTCFCEGAQGLEEGKQTDSDALCLSRSMCEEKCSELDGCGSFDMHQSLPRCYLNDIAETCSPVVDDMFERVVKAEDADCYPRLIRTESPADDAYGEYVDGLEGDYSERDADTFTRADDTNVQITWHGCHWRVEYHETNFWALSSMTYDDASVACTGDVDTSKMNTELFYAFCPERPPMMMQQLCEGMTSCPVLTRCIVSDLEMDSELSEDRPVARDQPLVLSNFCDDKTEFPISRQLASPNRAEATLDFEVYGPSPTINDDMRIVAEDIMLLRRDAVGAPESRLAMVSTSVSAVNVISAPVGDHAAAQLGSAAAAYSIPSGYVAFISDIVRVEAKVCGGGVGEARMSFHIGSGGLAQAFTFSATNPSGTELASTMDGDWLYVTVPAGAAVDIAIALDDDECGHAVLPCTTGAVCKNTLGSYTCECPEGFIGEGTLDKPCEEITYYCPPLNFRLSNAEALDFGWRLRETRLYVDEECQEEADIPLELYTVYDNDYRCYSNGVISTKDHVNDMVRGHNCNNKCTESSSFRQRRLAKNRRAQGDDWSNCAGMAKLGELEEDVEKSNLICGSQSTCQQMCNSLEDCASYAMNSDNSCLLYSRCPGPKKAATPAGGATVYVKSDSFGLSSSPSFEGHPVNLVYDTYGHDDKTDDHHTFTEWWSDCFSCEKDQAWIQVSVTPSAAQKCKIEGIKLWQDPNNAANRLYIAEGPRDRDALPASAGVRPDNAREKPDMGAPWTATWSFDAASDKCMPLTCGTKNTFLEGEVLKSIEGVESACLCKQYCLDHLERGCTAWRLNLEWDKNFSPDDVEHQHVVCDLLKGDNLVPADVQNWISGGVDTVIQSFGPMEKNPSEQFTLTVNGVGLPEDAKGGKQRVKLVPADSDLGCAAQPPETLSGIGCSDPAICAPRPATSDRQAASWNSVAIASGKETMEYSVCYCAGPCYADWQYVAVPNGNLRIEATNAWWSTFPAEIDRDSLKFNLTIEYDRMAYQIVETWRVKVIERGLNCADDNQSDQITYRRWLKDDSWQASWEWNIIAERDSAGKYLVCFCMVDESLAQDDTAACATESPWVPISSDESRFLNIALVDSDYAPPAGMYRGQRFSARADSEVTIEVGGRQLQTRLDPAGKIIIQNQTAGCGPNTHPSGEGHIDFQSYPNLGDDAEGSYTDDIIKFKGTTPAVAGVYDVCHEPDSAGEPGVFKKIGEFTVTERVDLGWTYIFDPNLDGSIEVTGTNLDWQKDRVMIIDCTGTCGLASPASGTALLDGKANTLKVSNAFIALNSEFDLLGNETTGTNEVLPLELRTYVRRFNSYCRGGNLNGDDLSDDVWAHQCHRKCSGCVGAACDGCEGFSPEHDGPDSTALCMSEVACREACSSTDICFGIDMYKYAPRCYLNTEGDLHGCKMQYEEVRLGQSAAYDFLAKDISGAVATSLAFPGTVSDPDVLRFAPIGFAREQSGAGKFKVCFCDSSLLPEGQNSCLAESDYGLEVGELYVSGVSCLLANPLFRRGTCYSMINGGLACSNVLELPSPQNMPSTAGLPTSWASFPI